MQHLSAGPADRWPGLHPPRRTGAPIAVSLTAVLLASLAPPAAAGLRSQDPAAAQPLPADIAGLLQRRCGGCHGEKKQKGDVRFDTLAQLSEDARTDLLMQVQEVLHFEEMPPDDEPQPSATERERLVTWLRETLTASDSTSLRDKLRQPQYGNLVDHDSLFTGDVPDELPSTPARRWRVSPAIFLERVKDVFELEGRDRKNARFFGVTNPFVLPEHSGVRDYDLGMLDGGHLLTMLGNARWIASKQVFAAQHRGVHPRDIEFDNPKDRWLPRNPPAEFCAVLAAEGVPDDDLLRAAIERQFQLVLRRAPRQDELRDRLQLAQDLCRAGGNVEGLRRLLMSVLLDSEFVYRLEFGSGEADRFGRRLLAPREAAFAIGYAIGDRGPDPELLLAADEGRLVTAADYEREVRRLLAADEFFRGGIDPSLNGKNYKTNENPHPKLVRFFREFFGYPAATKVFKDPPRADNFYQAPGRGTNGTPGWLILEADRFVARVVAADRDVFRRLLTSNEWFVYHNRSNEEGREVIAQWRAVWERFKDSDWQEHPAELLAEHQQWLSDQKHVRIDFRNEERAAQEFRRYLTFFSESFGQGRTPFTTVPWQHGYYFNHSVFYNFAPTPHAFRYGRANSKSEHPEQTPEFWDYPVEQPVAVPHRKGILTHPAWLIAHSTNFTSDPIRRGRWIREKLLAGRVPDVPITVDAKVPEHPEQTLRERVESVTEAEECWKCHKHMNPLGMPFEVFDDFGRFRTEERLEHPDNLTMAKFRGKPVPRYPTRPVVATGELTGTGDAQLDGPVDDAFDMIERLAHSDRARQSIVRHAFRFFLGRNELVTDAATLRAADRAYVDSGGSFQELVVSLLTSDSFRYRKQTTE